MVYFPHNFKKKKPLNKCKNCGKLTINSTFCSKPCTNVYRRVLWRNQYGFGQNKLKVISVEE
jgi:hypothetical protein